MVGLICALVGAKLAPFAVDVETSGTVDALTEDIKQELRRRSQDLQDERFRAVSVQGNETAWLNDVAAVEQRRGGVSREIKSIIEDKREQMLESRSGEEANEGTDEDATSNKRRRRDSESSMPHYSSLSWDALERILSLVYYEPPLKNVSDSAVKLLHNCLKLLRKLYGDVIEGSGAKRRGTKRISIVEAKHDDMVQDMVECVADLEALADVHKVQCTQVREW